MYTIKTIDPNILKDNSVIEDINQRTTNIYFNINQITKNLESIDNKKNILKCLYNQNNQICCLMIIGIDRCGVNDCFLESIECAVIHQGYGKIMIDSLINSHEVLHWMCNPEMSTNLYDYYKRTYNFNEYTLSKNISCYKKTTTFFYKCDDVKKRKCLFDFYNTFSLKNYTFNLKCN